MSIKPGLIIYHAKKYHAYPRICNKYRLVPDHLDYNLCNLKHLKGPRLKILRSHYISKVSHSVNLSWKIAKRISQLSTQPSYFRRLRLVLCWPKSEEQISKFTRKVLRKLFSKAKRVSSIEVELETEKGFKKSILKHLAFLRSLKNMKIRFFFSQKMTFEALQNLLFSSKTKKMFPHFEHAYLQFVLKPDPVLNKECLETYLMNLSEALHGFKQSQMINSTHFKLRLPFSVATEATPCLQFVQSFKSLPNLAHLGHTFEPAFPSDFSAKIVQNLKDLISLNFCLVGSHTELLPQIIQKALGMKSLKKLVIWIRKLKIEPVKTFFRELKGLQQIDWLILNFENGVGLDDDAMKILGQSLGNLKNLKRFKISLEVTTRDLTITADGLDKMLQGIGKMSKLKELNLFVNGFGEMFSHKLYQTIWTCLKKLKELSILTLYFPGNRFEENDLALFEKYFKRSLNLQSLIISFQGLNPVSSERLGQFIRTFESLKRLKMLGLKLNCTELNDNLTCSFTSTLHSMKNLDTFVLNLLSGRNRDGLSALKAFNEIVKFEDRKRIIIEGI